MKFIKREDFFANKGGENLRARVARFVRNWALGTWQRNWPLSFAYAKLRRQRFDGTFASQVRQRLAYDRRKILVRFVDKLAAREFCRAATDRIELPKIYQVVDQAEDLDSSLWSEECVIKPSHGSGALVMVTRKPRESLRYSIPSDTFRWDDGIWGMLSQDVDAKSLSRLAKRWLESCFENWTEKIPEWAYRHVPRKVIVEELIAEKNGKAPVEARFHCFHGTVRICRVTDVLSEDKYAWTLSRSGKVLNAWLESDRNKVARPFEVPRLWELAVSQAEQLSRNIDYVRVDLYILEDRLVFSELTPYPNGGTVDFVPLQLSQWLAGLWRGSVQPSDIGEPPVEIVAF